MDKAKMKKMLPWILTGVVVLVIIFSLARGTKKAVVAPTTDTVAEETGDTNNTESEPATSAPKALSYSEAVKKYAGKTIQFNDTCQANPAQNMVFKQGTTIMLDNRSGKAHTVKLAGKTYQVGAYKYRTSTLSTTGTFQVDCDVAQNVATIQVVQ